MAATASLIHYTHSVLVPAGLSSPVFEVTIKEASNHSIISNQLLFAVVYYEHDVYTVSVQAAVRSRCALGARALSHLCDGW